MSKLSCGLGELLPVPVRRVYCVGRNYAEHRKEMGGNERDEPFFFSKPADAVFQSNTLHYPKGTKCLNYEGEFVVIMRSATEILGYCLGVDLTKRDVQMEAKKQGRPWDSSKGFDNSGLLGDIACNADMGTLSSCRLIFEQNGEIKQSARLSDMIWPVDELLVKLQEQDFSIAAGDVIFTGTPAGVGELHVGDTCKVRLVLEDGTHCSDALPPLEFTVAP